MSRRSVRVASAVIRKAKARISAEAPNEPMRRA
jgi:hypothetical protein